MKNFTIFFHRSFYLIMLASFCLNGQAQLIQQLDSVVNFQFDTNQISYQADVKTYFYYNSMDQNTHWVSYELSPATLTFFPEDSASYSYNSSGERIEEIYSRWEPDSQRFIVLDRSEFKYNSNGQLTARYDFNYNKDSISWDSSAYLLINYNANQQILKERTFFYDTAASEWRGEKRYDYSYDSTSQMLNEIKIYDWDIFTNDWKAIADDKRVFVYNPSTQFLDTVYHYEFNDQLNTFETSFRTAYINDPLGNQLQLREQSLISNYWVTTDRFMYDYDTTVALSELALPINYTIGFDLPQQKSKRNYEITRLYDSMRTIPYLADSTQYYYSNINATSLSNEASIDGNVSLYPNPANEQLNFNIEDATSSSYRLIIFDQNGRLLINQIYSNQSRIQLNVSDLASGVYLYNLTDSEHGNTSEGKFIVQGR